MAHFDTFAALSFDEWQMASMKHYILGLIAVTLFLFGVGWSYFFFFSPRDLTVGKLLPFVYFFGITLLVHVLTKRSLASSEPSHFVYAFMGSLGVKMLASLVYLTGYLLLFRGSEGLLEFAVMFLFLYLCYSVYEVFVLFKLLRVNKG